MQDAYEARTTTEFEVNNSPSIKPKDRASTATAAAAGPHQLLITAAELVTE